MGKPTGDGEKAVPPPKASTIETKRRHRTAEGEAHEKNVYSSPSIVAVTGNPDSLRRTSPATRRTGTTPQADQIEPAEPAPEPIADIEPTTEPEPVADVEPEPEPEPEPAPENPLTFTDCTETVYATSTVNLRSGPSTDYEKIGSLSTGDSVTRTGIGTGDYSNWSRITQANGTEVYVNNGYISTTKPVVQQTAKPTTGTTASKPSGNAGGSTQTPNSGTSGSGGNTGNTIGQGAAGLLADEPVDFTQFEGYNPETGLIENNSTILNGHGGSSSNNSNEAWAEERGQGLAGLADYVPPQGESEWEGGSLSSETAKVNMS